MFKKRTMMLMMGQRAERLREERKRDVEIKKMLQHMRSNSRDRARAVRRLKPLLDHQDQWRKDLDKDAREESMALAVPSSNYYRIQDKKDQARLQQSMDDKDNYISEIEKAKLEISDLEKEIKEITDNIERIKKFVCQRKIEHSKFRTPTEFNVTRRMDVACRALGEQLHANRESIALIRDLCVERDVTVKAFDMLTTETEEMERQALVQVEAARELFQQRDQTRRAITNLRELYERKTVAFEGEKQQLQFKVDSIKSTEKFILDKNKQRGDETGAQKLAQKRQMTSSDRDVISYKVLIMGLKQGLGDQQMFEIVSSFTNLVAENYMLFHNLSETRCKVHELLRDRTALREKIVKMRGAYLRAEREKIAFENELHEKQVFFQETAERLEGKIERSDDIIEMYTEGVMAMLDELGYTPREITRLAGGQEGEINEKNVLLFLGELEQYVNKLWDMQNFVEYVNYTQRRLTEIGQTIPIHRCPPRFTLVARMSICSVGYHDEEDEEGTTSSSVLPFMDLVPQTLEEVTEQVLDELERRVEVCSVPPLPDPVMTDPAGRLVDIPEEVPPQSVVSRSSKPSKRQPIKPPEEDVFG